MSMLHDEDDDYIMDRKVKGGVVLGLVAAVSAVVLVLLITFAVNNKPLQKTSSSAKANNSAEDGDNSDLSSLENEKRTSDELSFWHMYDEDETNNTYVPSVTNEGQDDKVKEKFIPDEDDEESDIALSENSASSQQHERDTVSGNVFDVNELTEGKAEFVDILGRIPTNTRYEEGFTTTGIWKEYALNGRKTSYHGIDISSYQKNIDWPLVAASGVDFAMIRVGSRGYGSGKVVLDTALVDNMRGCSENGIKIGLYFQSQAVNMIEAIEEANYCIGAINGQTVEYPIVFSSEAVLNDSYRTENLSSSELSEIARAFCETVRAYGYTPMIAATKKQFATKMDLTTLGQYDFWLYDTDEMSVFPYRYNMWQYSINGTVDGISDPVNLDISFTDYSVK
ncbi:MAG: glycoside hydrolase family 25 protein [Lachnospiraceae bacterium]|nr:glycoside hydrolase family 25 protein [Lachnospiraceae bacterium]